jgi:ABC-type uncharacterized transport system ATPase subunit
MVHAALGENGGGKLRHAHRVRSAADAGRIILDDREVRFDSPAAMTPPESGWFTSISLTFRR